MSRKNTTCLLPKKGQQLRCHCGCLAVLRPAEEVCKPPFPGAMAYVCSNYPKCDSFVIADPVTKQPRGSLADSNLRRLRYLAHNQFDRLHQSGRMTRKEAGTCDPVAGRARTYRAHGRLLLSGGHPGEQKAAPGPQSERRSDPAKYRR